MSLSTSSPSSSQNSDRCIESEQGQGVIMDDDDDETFCLHFSPQTSHRQLSGLMPSANAPC